MIDARITLICRAVLHMASLGVLFLPVPTNGIADFDQPTMVFRHFQHVRRGKILGGIWRKITERLEQPGIDQRGNIVRLAV